MLVQGFSGWLGGGAAFTVPSAAPGGGRGMETMGGASSAACARIAVGHSTIRLERYFTILG